MIVGDVVDLECAGVDVAQYQVGGAGSADGSDARKLPIHPNRADEGGARELVVVDVVDLQSARAAIAQQEIAFAGDAAEVADAGESPIHPDRANKGRAGDLIAVDVVGLQSPVLASRRSISLVPRLLKLPMPENCQFKPTAPMKAEAVI